jgi:hypothetical protein
VQAPRNQALSALDPPPHRYPSGVDVTLQRGDHWFYTPGDSLNPLATLIDFYHASVGNNGHLEIDFAIDRTGGIDPKHKTGCRLRT